MTNHPLTRRQFGAWAGKLSAGAFVAGLDLSPAEASPPVEWPIGCFNRPWGRWTYDEALEGIRAAGFRLTGLLGDHKDEPFTLPDATDAYLNELRERIGSRGLSIDVAWLRTDHKLPLGEASLSARKQIDHARRLGAKFLLTVGVDDPAVYDHYYQVMQEAADYAEREMQVVLKPHGGCSASADEILQCIDRVGRDNFRVWYDAGNIVHYTGRDPVADIERVAHLVAGFSAKDCGQKGGDVMLQFGTGNVDFAGVFKVLKRAAFRGPVIVECCAGQTLEEVAANARANREFLERLFATL